VFVQLYRQQQRMSELLIEAEAASRAKSEFLRMAAHELRTPLAVLTGYVSMLRDGTFGPAPDTWAPPLDVLRRKSRELTTLVNDILEAARIEAGATVAVPHRFDVRRAVEGAVSRSQERAREVAGELALEMPPVPVWVHADPEQVARILDNLLENALTYCRGTPRVRLALHAGDEALIEVEDQGIGIAPELREKVFERFFRIDDPELAMRPGTGLGLYISRELAHRNGGGLMVAESEPGQGSRITLTLPRIEA
jgi:signal transduction histidine kinase